MIRDEGHAHAQRLDAGVPTQYRMEPGQLHGFLGGPTTFRCAEPALNDSGAALHHALAHLSNA